MTLWWAVANQTFSLNIIFSRLFANVWTVDRQKIWLWLCLGVQSGPGLELPSFVRFRDAALSHNGRDAEMKSIDSVNSYREYWFLGFIPAYWPLYKPCRRGRFPTLNVSFLFTTDVDVWITKINWFAGVVSEGLVYPSIVCIRCRYVTRTDCVIVNNKMFSVSWSHQFKLRYD